DAVARARTTNDDEAAASAGMERLRDTLVAAEAAAHHAEVTARAARTPDGTATPRIAGVDAAGSWDDAAGTVVVPDADAGTQLQTIDAALCVVNLAAPGALRTALAARAAGVTTRFWACAVPAERSDGFAIGAFEVVPRPLDPEAIATALARV